MSDKARIATLTDALRHGLATAQRLGADAAKIHLSRSRHVSCDFENGRLKDTGTVSRESYTIDVLAGGKRGSTSGNVLADLDEMVSRAVALAKAGSAAHFDAYPAPGKTMAVKTHSPKTAALARETLIADAQRMVDAVKAHDPELFIAASAGRSESDSLLATTGGVEHHTPSTTWWLGCHAQRTRGTDMLFTGEHRHWADVNELYDPDYLSRTTIEDLRLAETTAEAPVGRVTAVLDPDVLGMLLAAVEMGVNGRNVAKGDSPLSDRLGEQILDPSLTIIDDPHLDFAPGAAEIDGDGVPTQRLTIVEKGVLECFLYDLDSAGLAGAEPTGNGGCRPHVVEVAPGATASETLIASLDDGVYIKALIGFGQSNLINGDFSGNVALGYRVKGGEIVGRIKDTMVAGNVYDLLKQNVRLSADRDPQTRLPYAVVEGLSTSAARA